MSTAPLFVHLRVHSAYSLAEGTFQIGALVSAVKAMGQPAVAITDSFNTFAALEFSDKANGAGIQPIIGAQVILSDDDNATSGEVVLLVQNETGWLNLSQLISDALLADSDLPSNAMAQLADYHEGLILLSGGATKGFVGGAAADVQSALAESRLTLLTTMMPGRVYV